jgi:cytochrome oxidase assembly protein ShyY1
VVGYIYLREFALEGDTNETFLVNLGWIPRELKEKFENFDMSQQNEIIGLLKKGETNKSSQAQLEMEDDLDGLYQIDLNFLQKHTQNKINNMMYIGKVQIT